MPKVKILVAEGLTQLENSCNAWINMNWGTISEVYDVRIQGNHNDGWVAVITYEVNHGK